MKNVLITGANRGLGLALATRFAAKADTHVIAVARDVATADELQALVDSSGGRVRALQADVAEVAAIEALANGLGDVSIDVLVNNAGAASREIFGDVTVSDLQSVFAVNTFAPLLVTQALGARLASGGKVVNISSVLGSIENARGEAAYFTYGMSKAALNMFSVQLAAHFAERNIAVLALHPGWVRTRMGGAEAAIDVDTSADGMMRVIDALEMRTTGSYLAYDGSTIPW